MNKSIIMENTEIKLDKSYIKGIIQDILNKNHVDTNKRNIKEFPDRLNFACPICGDSHKFSHKKRGNLYLHNMYYKCFNEPECSRTFMKMINTFNIDIDLDKKLELYDYIENNIKYNTILTEDNISDFKRNIPLTDFINYFQSNKSDKITHLRPLTNGSVVYDYVVNKRKIKNHKNIYEAIYHITPTWQQPVMVFLNMVKDNIIGMQTRNLFDGEKRIFKIYDFSHIYDMIYPENDMDEQEKIPYNKISHFYNLYNIDWTKYINIFEGYIDSLSLPNSIGLVGLNTDMRFLLNEESISLRFIFDNDISGFKKTKTYIKNKQYVFLWNKFFIDVSKKYKGSKSQKDVILDLSEKIKDFNKLSTYFKKPIYQQFDLDKYFSNDDLDLEYLNPIEDVIKNSFLLYV